MVTKPRLDHHLVTRGLCVSHAAAAALVMAGRVRIGGRVILKSGYPVAPDDEVTLDQPAHPYVSRGGVKMEAALQAFAIDVTDYTCADVGASTGGFTDCLLRHGAHRVYAIDVGRGQLARSLETDPLVVKMEQTNVREVTGLPEPIDLVTIDVSFISLRTVLPLVRSWLTPEGRIVVLFKPQFEADSADAAEHKGVIRSATLREQLLTDFLVWLAEHQFSVLGQIQSPLKGDKGNVEYLLCLLPQRD